MNKTKDLVLCGMFAALMAVISQLSIPMPSGVPITLQIFGVALIGSVLGWRLGAMSLTVYLLIGAVGLPVFANFGGGLSRLVGVTGGYLWSYPFMAAFCGIRPQTGKQRLDLILSLLSALCGLAVCELIGGLQWAALSGGAMTLKGVFTYALAAFIPKDTVLTVVAVLLSGSVRNMLQGHS